MQPGGTSKTITATISHKPGALWDDPLRSLSPMMQRRRDVVNCATFTVNGSAPANDNIANAIAVTTSNFSKVPSTIPRRQRRLPTPHPLCALISPSSKHKSAHEDRVVVAHGSLQADRSFYPRSAVLMTRRSRFGPVHPEGLTNSRAMTIFPRASTGSHCSRFRRRPGRSITLWSPRLDHQTGSGFARG